MNLTLCAFAVLWRTSAEESILFVPTNTHTMCLRAHAGKATAYWHLTRLLEIKEWKCYMADGDWVRASTFNSLTPFRSPAGSWSHKCNVPLDKHCEEKTPLYTKDKSSFVFVCAWVSEWASEDWWEDVYFSNSQQFETICLLLRKQTSNPDYCMR